VRLAVQTEAKPRRSLHSEAVILFSVANQQFTIAADAVQEIRSTDSLGGAANEIDQQDVPKVHHTIERANRRYYVVNAGAHFGLPVTRPALVLILRQLRVAVLVDRIERMTEISRVYPLPHAFTGKERGWYRGLAYLDNRVVPVIRPNGFLTAEDFRLLDAASEAARSHPDLQGAVQA
jgi:chemotaxis signal transduction protein